MGQLYSSKIKKIIKNIKSMYFVQVFTNNNNRNYKSDSREKTSTFLKVFLSFSLLSFYRSLALISICYFFSL